MAVVFAMDSIDENSLTREENSDNLLKDEII